MTYPQQGPIAYGGPQGAAAMSQPLQPPPPPAPVPTTPTPFAGEQFVPGEMAFFTYRDARDPEGKTRTQVVSVAHVDEGHVHAIVLGDASQLASFEHGVLTHGYPLAG